MLFVHVNADNTAAQELYRKCGLKVRFSYARLTIDFILRALSKVLVVQILGVKIFRFPTRILVSI